MQQARFLMCPPDHFGVEYVINPWMQGQISATNNEVADRQWLQLRQVLSRYATVSSLPPVKGLPDLVFTANAAVLYKQTAVLSSFRFPQRQPEAQHFGDWLTREGFTVETLPPGVRFEGAGDALLDRSKPLLWFGHGFRSELAAGEYLQQHLNVELQELELCDPRFYHLDTCFCPLERGYLLYFPEAFTPASNAAIEARVPLEKRLPVSEADAVRFACNAVNVGSNVVLNDASNDLISRLEECGFEVIKTPVTEFMRSGGATKCLSLRLDEAHSMA